jgi:hypothetical protein
MRIFSYTASENRLAKTNRWSSRSSTAERWLDWSVRLGILFRTAGSPRPVLASHRVVTARTTIRSESRCRSAPIRSRACRVEQLARQNHR